MHGRVAVLDAAVVAAAEQRAVRGEQGSPDRDAPFGQAGVGLGEGHIEKWNEIRVGHARHSAGRRSGGQPAPRCEQVSESLVDIH